MRESIVHLDTTLREAYVKDLVLTSLFLNHLDIGHIVIQAHLRPAKLPKRWITNVSGGAILTVLCATIVAHPDIIAFINQDQRKWLSLFVLIQHSSAIETITMLHKYGAFVSLNILTLLTSYVEGSQAIIVSSHHILIVPIISVLFHHILESRE